MERAPSLTSPGSDSTASEKKKGAEALTKELERNCCHTNSSSSSSLKETSTLGTTSDDVPPIERSEDEEPPNMEQIALKALHVDDDPTLNPWTFRVFFIGW